MGIKLKFNIYFDSRLNKVYIIGGTFAAYCGCLITIRSYTDTSVMFWCSRTGHNGEAHRKIMALALLNLFIPLVVRR